MVLLSALPRNLLCLDEMSHPIRRSAFDLSGLTAGNSIAQALDGSADFVVGDLPMNQAEVEQVRDARGIRMLSLPTAIEATVPCYNLPGMKSSLKLSPTALAGIFLGKITKWNDPAIAAVNPSVRLPGKPIVLIQRTEENGSTYAWTDYLSKASPEWKSAVGTARSLALPIPLSSEGPDSIAQMVKDIPGSIAFLELWAAKKANLQFGRVRNRAGFFVEATPDSMLAAVESDLTFLLRDFRESITDAPGERSYPICGFTWVIVADTIRNAEKRQKVIAFLKWVLTNGQSAPDALFYGRLPQPLLGCELHAVDGIR